MAPIHFQSIADLLSNDPSVFSDAADVLLRVSRNIIKNPTNPKFRRIKLSASDVQNKLIPASGALECLFEMGFEEGSTFLELPPSISIDKVRLFHDELLRKKEGQSQAQAERNTQIQPSVVSSTPAVSTPGPSTAPSPIPKPHIYISPLLHKIVALRNTINNSFLKTVLHHFERVLQYENKRLQLDALKCIPLDKLKSNVEMSIRSIQESYKGKKVQSENINYQELMLLSLLSWFKQDFFTWVDSPPCQKCTRDNPKKKGVKPSNEPGVDRIEIYECETCGEEVTFPRYNDAGKLLITRKGRCGEWANCFTLMCLAMGWDARLIHDETDHAWTEVYLAEPGTWVHCDPCEGIMDAPLLYEAGWKKQLSYVFAYSCEEMQDVTWRYSSKHKEVMKRRQKCREDDLVQLIAQVRDLCGERLSPARRQFVLKRSLREIVDMLLERQPTPNDLKGRTSGSLSWRLERGETNPTQEYVWNVKMDESELGKWVLGYSAAKDQYIQKGRPITDGTWLSRVYKASNVQRKVEKDWKMAYIARLEESETGTIAWRFKVEDGFNIDKIEVSFRRTLFTTGQVVASLCSEVAVIEIPMGGEPFTTSYLSGCKELVLTALLSGGEGDIAWQHAQLFRQSLSDEDYPLQLTLHIKASTS